MNGLRTSASAHRNSHRVCSLNFPATSSSSAASALPHHRFGLIGRPPAPASSPKTTRFWSLQTDRQARTRARQPRGDQRSLAYFHAAGICQSTRPLAPAPERAVLALPRLTPWRLHVFGDVRLAPQRTADRSHHSPPPSTNSLPRPLLHRCKYSRAAGLPPTAERGSAESSQPSAASADAPGSSSRSHRSESAPSSPTHQKLDPFHLSRKPFSASTTLAITHS